jgi:hypothetical protein
MPMLKRLCFCLGKATPKLTRDGTREESAAHPNLSVDTPAVNCHAGLVQSPLPCEYMGIDCVNKCAVQVKDQCSHTILQAKIRNFLFNA